MDTTLSIIVVEPDRDKALAIVDALRLAGNYEVMVIGETTGLARRVLERNPDVILIDVDNPTRDSLEQLTLATSPMERPVAMFVPKEGGALARRAVESGVSAYVVDGLQPERLAPILEAALARFHMMRKMRVELDQTRKALEERKVIDRAKGVLMKARGLDEDAAYALLRKTAMDQGRRVVDVAQAIVTTAQLLS